MHVLVTWGSKRGGTEGIGRAIADSLAEAGFEVTTLAASEVTQLETFDAVIVGGALYANRWPSDVRRFVQRNVARLRERPVWMLASGPLDDSAEHGEIPATPQVGVLAERIGAVGHVTFGGRLEPDARGFPASAIGRPSHG